MKNKLLSVVILACCIASLFVVPSLGATDGSQILKIGLHYSTDALPGVNFLNVENMGKGFQLGYFDGSTRQFTSLYSTQEGGITVLKDKSVYAMDDGSYKDTVQASYTSVVHPYHVQYPGSFQSADQASSLLNEISSKGLSSFMSYTNGSYVVRSGNYATKEAAEKAVKSVRETTNYITTVVGYSDNCYTVIKTGTDKILFELDVKATPLGIMPTSTGGQPTQTWVKGYKYKGGFELNRVNGNDITVISVINETDYLKGVLPYEVGPTWHTEALKAQALCAKSYAYNNMGKHKAIGFDICNTTHCQMYQGTGRATTNCDQAVEALVGKYIMYDGKVAQAYYHNSSGGHTEDVENIWGSYIPYLRGVPDEYLKDMNTGVASWTTTVSLETITKILRSKNHSVYSIQDYYVSKFSPYGNVMQVTFVDSDGSTLKFSGESARTILNSSANKVEVKSHRYTVSSNSKLYVGASPTDNSVDEMYALSGSGAAKRLVVNNQSAKVITKDGIGSLSSGKSGTYTIQGSGSGHNVGLSQWGARGMAEKGFSADAIIKHFFTGVTIGNAN